MVKGHNKRYAIAPPDKISQELGGTPEHVLSRRDQENDPLVFWNTRRVGRQVTSGYNAEVL